MPQLTKAGIRMHLGKGALKPETVAMFKESNAVFAVMAPVTALLESKVKSKRCLAHPELGMEAFYELQVEEFPCIIAAAQGESMF
jgi:fumarate hydratase subunit beta